MLMPVLRLVGIYVVVGLAIFAIFNRDKISTLFGSANEATAIEETAMQPDNADNSTNLDAAQMASSEQESTAQLESLDAGTTMEDAVIAPVSNEPIAIVQTQLAQQPASSQSVQQVDLATRLDNARRAFWNGDTNGSETIYRQIVAQYPDSTDANGELANILFSSRRFNEAAVYYYAVGEISHRVGNNAQVMNMIGVLRGIAPQKAQQLSALANTRPQ